MSERKPEGLSWESWVDVQVSAARERGEFDNLPGEGKPIPDLLKPYDEHWWVKQLIAREGLDVTPAAFQLKRDVERTRSAVMKLRSEKGVREYVEKINARITKRNRTRTDGPSLNLMPLDTDAIVEDWTDHADARAALRPTARHWREQDLTPPNPWALAIAAGVVFGGLGLAILAS